MTVLTHKENELHNRLIVAEFNLGQVEEELRRLHEVKQILLDALLEMVEAYQYEASSENPSLLNARIAIAKAQGDNNATN